MRAGVLCAALIVFAAPVAAQQNVAERPGLWLSAPSAVASGQGDSFPRPDLTRVPLAPADTSDTGLIERPPEQEVVARPVLPVPDPSVPRTRPQPRPRDAAPAVAQVVVTPAAPREVAPAIPAPAPVVDAEPLVLIVPTAPVTVGRLALPSAAPAVRRAAQPSRLYVPGPDVPPVGSRPRPPGPAAQDVLAALPNVGVLPEQSPPVPLPAAAPPRPLRMVFAAAPAPDLFPVSALPPSALPPGPEALDDLVIPPVASAEPMSAVLLAPRPVAPMRPGAPIFPDFPTRDAAPRDPAAPIPLPQADRLALARLVEETAICWRMARLGPEARWADLSVEVALDETNTAAASSIRLTGFGGVMSDAAEEAFRAAEAALVGCGSASAEEPVTARATLIFDPDGVRLR